MKKQIIIFVCLFFLAHLSFATAFVCPNTFKTVITGYTTDQVLAQCGKPTSTTQSQTQANSPIFEEQWIYSLPSTNTLLGGSVHNIQLVISFQQNVVSSIAVNNPNLAVRFACYRSGQLRPGLTTNQVQAMCGMPTFIDNYQRTNTQTVTIENWVYNFGPNRPQMIFIFQNGVLQQINMGQISQ